MVCAQGVSLRWHHEDPETCFQGFKGPETILPASIVALQCNQPLVWKQSAKVNGNSQAPKGRLWHVINMKSEIWWFRTRDLRVDLLVVGQIGLVFGGAA